MTDREKAIKEIEILKEDYWDDDGYGYETNQHNDTMLALDMAIKALEKEPCDDCISREEAIKPFLVDATEEWTSADIVKYLKSLLSVMPTMIYPQVPGITPIVVPVEEESEDIQYDNKTTLNKW